MTKTGSGKTQTEHVSKRAFPLIALSGAQSDSAHRRKFCMRAERRQSWRWILFNLLSTQRYKQSAAGALFIHLSSRNNVINILRGHLANQQQRGRDSAPACASRIQNAHTRERLLSRAPAAEGRGKSKSPCLRSLSAPCICVLFWCGTMTGAVAGKRSFSLCALHKRRARCQQTHRLFTRICPSRQLSKNAAACASTGDGCPRRLLLCLADVVSTQLQF